ncbi:hypothetical protein BGZ65_011852 [Modicella reniformis]|uniref:Crinkler effector protein N-terminal domain-containing protein n=1 Tax=Modicella reniformis TaxID=1440133 RepID=A0A9P6MBN5_9FUNG|nr:hypothetical protein BGZ65_011852 [Modicella reniformis]
MTPISVFCVFHNQPASSAFCISIDPALTVDELRDEIKIKQSPYLDHIAASSLSLWQVSIPVSSASQDSVTTAVLQDDAKLLPTVRLSSIFFTPPADNTIHILVKQATQAEKKDGDNMLDCGQQFQDSETPSKVP